LLQEITACEQQRVAEREQASTSSKSSKRRKPSPLPAKKAKAKPKPKIPAGKSRKIRVYPTSEQRKTFRKWFGSARWTYNECLKEIEESGVAKEKKALRAKCLNAECFQVGQPKAKSAWVLETPFDLRDEAMADLLKAYKSSFAKGGGFKMRFRSKKQPRQTLAVLAKHWGHKRGEYAQVFGANVLRAAEPLPETLAYDSRLQLTKLGEFYFCIPMPLAVRHESQVPATSNDNETAGVISLDPGVRTFQTGYDPSGLVVECGKYDIGRIYRLCYVLDDLQSRWSQKEVKHHKRYRMRRAGRRIQAKIRNLVDDLHRKLTKWLVEHYRVVLIPVFETQRMIRRGQRRLHSKTARAMCTWSHYRFRTRLQDKVREHPWCKVIPVTEEYTSKTCGRCGQVHAKLGGNKVFRCPNCRLVVDRDINGARNILLKYLSTPSG
jgi:putative transposase